MNTNVNPPVRLASVAPNVLESIAFNLCSLHGFDVAFVRENERFATAVITEYARCHLAGCAPEGRAVPFDREGLIALIMEETTDDIVADGWNRLGKPNVLVQGCRYIRRNAPPSPEGYANPEASAKQFAGFIADRVLKALATREEAPTPEGGAVSELIEAAKDCQRLGRSTGEDTPENRKRARAQYRLNQLTTPKAILAALATREEAPAGAGEVFSFADRAHDAAVALRAILDAPDDATRRPHARYYLERLEEALRAQPPAREDAQPVGWRSIDSAPKDGTVIDVWRADGGKDTVHWGKPHHDCGEAGGYCDSDWHSIRAPGWVCNTFEEFLGRNHNPFTHWKPLDEGPDAEPSPALTHPAPDALRGAVEALKRARWALYSHYVEWDGEPEDAGPLQSAVTDCDQALAALQAEQKGGAA